MTCQGRRCKRRMRGIRNRYRKRVSGFFAIEAMIFQRIAKESKDEGMRRQISVSLSLHRCKNWISFTDYHPFSLLEIKVRTGKNKSKRFGEEAWRKIKGKTGGRPKSLSVSLVLIICRVICNPLLFLESPSLESLLASQGSSHSLSQEDWLITEGL